MNTRRTPYTAANYISGKTVKKYMLANIQDHIDPVTGEVNATALAEDACIALDGFEGNNIPEKFFELTELLAERHEIKTGIIAPPISRNLAGLINSLESDWL